jgi:uncharacterized protein (TIGR02271 family)
MGRREPSIQTNNPGRESRPVGSTVVDAEGRSGTIRRQVDDPAGAHYVVDSDTGDTLLIPISLLRRQSEGAFSLAYTFSALREMGREGRQGNADTVVIPVVEEEVAVAKQRTVTGRVRIHKTVEEREETIETPIMYDQVHIERVALNRLVSEPATQRQEGATLVLPVHKEVLVVEKRLMLVEEIHITKQQRQDHMQDTVTLRKENVTVEHIDNTPEE